MLILLAGLIPGLAFLALVVGFITGALPRGPAFAIIVFIVGSAIGGNWFLSQNNPGAHQRYCVKSVYDDTPLINSDDTHWKCLEWTK